MELLVLIPTVIIVVTYIAYKEWVRVAYQQWLSELDLFKKRLAAYEQLKIAVSSVRDRDAVSDAAPERFAQALSDMRFLFDEDLEKFVGEIHGALVKKHDLDKLLEKVVHKEKSPEDAALTEKALEHSRELSGRITSGIYDDMPNRMERFMRPAPLYLAKNIRRLSSAGDGARPWERHPLVRTSAQRSISHWHQIANSPALGQSK